jgi:cytochrome c oxidase cbb3-type subunit IV
MTYEAFRQFADSWGLVYMFVVFAIVVALVLRPGAKKQADEAAQIPFHEDR